MSDERDATDPHAPDSRNPEPTDADQNAAAASSQTADATTGEPTQATDPHPTAVTDAAIQPQRQKRREVLGTATIAAALVVLFLTVPLSNRDWAAWWLILISAGALFLFISTLWRSISRGANLMRLVNLLLIVVIVFAFGFYTVATNMPGEFEGIETRIDALYFTLTTMTTTGYGDIHATGQIGRVLVPLAFVFDIIFLGLLGAELGRLASQGRGKNTEAAS